MADKLTCLQTISSILSFQSPRIWLLFRQLDELLKPIDLQEWFDGLSKVEDITREANTVAKRLVRHVDEDSSAYEVRVMVEYLHACQNSMDRLIEETRAHIATIERIICGEVTVRGPSFATWLSNNSNLNGVASTTRIEKLLHCALDGSKLHEDIVLSFRGTNAGAILCVMHDILNHSKSDNGIYGAQWVEHIRLLRRLSVRLARLSGVIPATLFLHGIVCTGEDLIPVSDGYFAEVFRAIYKGQQVGLKRLRVFQSVDKGREDIMAFCREASVWSLLHHPFIQPLLGVDRSTFPRRNCMVSPWMKFGNIGSCMRFLARRGERAPLDSWIQEISQGLEYLHSEEIIHGDLRGANILIDDDLHVRLVDFGLALFADASTASAGSHFGGAARWMAPELLGSYTERSTYASDIYSFGCTCVEVYSRRKLFPRLNDVQVMYQVLQGARPSRPTADSGTSMSDDLWALVKRCWTATVSERPSAIEISTRLSVLPKGSIFQDPRPSSTPFNSVDPSMIDETNITNATKHVPSNSKATQLISISQGENPAPSMPREWAESQNIMTRKVSAAAEPCLAVHQSGKLKPMDEFRTKSITKVIGEHFATRLKSESISVPFIMFTVTIVLIPFSVILAPSTSDPFMQSSFFVFFGFTIIFMPAVYMLNAITNNRLKGAKTRSIFGVGMILTLPMPGIMGISPTGSFVVFLASYLFLNIPMLAILYIIYNHRSLPFIPVVTPILLDLGPQS